MTLEDLGNLGEFVGATAVVISLIYVAIQVRQNTARMASSTEEAKLAGLERVLEGASRWRAMVVQNPEVANLMMRGAADLSSLNQEEALRFFFLQSQILHTTEVYFVRCQKIAPERWAVTRANLVALMDPPGTRKLWDQIRPHFDPAFAVEVDTIIAELGPPQPMGRSHSNQT